MQFKLDLLASIAVCISSAAGAAITTNARRDTAGYKPCADPQSAVPFLRAYNGALTDHFYTTNAAEMQVATTTGGYSSEGSVGRIFPTQVDSTVPLYRAFNPTQEDHFYTANAAEFQSVTDGSTAYNSEGIAGYVYNTADTEYECYSIPLYRLYHPTLFDHFYTQSAAERDNAVNNIGYNSEGIVGYILPA